MKLPKILDNQKGTTQLLFLVAAVGIIAFLLASSTFPFKDRLFSILYPKPSSYAASSPSGQDMPVGDINGWHQVFTDDFLTDVPLGSFPAAVYTKWAAYPTGWLDTSHNGTYYPSKVLSVSSGLLNMYLHTENVSGVPTHMVSTPMPIIVPNGLNGPPDYANYGKGQLYGRFSVRLRSDSLHGYKTAFLLWPNSEIWPGDGEIDFPESNLDSNTIGAYMHWQGGTSGNSQDAYSATADRTAWHTYTIDWTPTAVTFYLDGAIVGKSTNTSRIPNTPMSWRLQAETTLDGYAPADSTAGNVQVDWVAVYEPCSTCTTPTPTPTPTGVTPVGQTGIWNLIFSDEFNGSAVDITKWTPGWFGTGITGPVNSAELACYDSTLATLGGGNLHLRLIAQQNTCKGSTRPYTGSIVSSNGKFQYAYGYIEFRAYLPPASAGKIANWPATWSDGQSWPTDGENDTMEGLSDGTACYHFHSDLGGPGGCASGDFTGWHTFASDWEPGIVQYYYDGNKVGQITTGITSAPQYLIIDNTTKGSNLVIPTEMLVDYVRVWKKDTNSSPSPTPTSSPLPTPTPSPAISTGSIKGVVSSSLGGALGGVKVSTTVSGTKKNTITSSTGSYTFANLPPGNYSLTFQARGYANQTVSVTVVSNQETTKNLTMVKR